MASLKDSVWILVNFKMPTNEYAVFKTCASRAISDMTDTSDRSHMTTANRTAVNKIMTVVAEILATHIGSRLGLIRLFSRNRFKGVAVFLKAALIHDQNMVPGATQLEPSLVSTKRMVNTYMSPDMAVALNEWLGTAGTKLLPDGGIQETTLEQGPAQGVMTMTVDNEPMFRVESPQSAQSEICSRKRSTSETTKTSSTRPPSNPVTPKQVTRVILKREFTFGRYVPEVRNVPRRICTYYMEGRCKYEDTCRYSHNFAHEMERLADPVS
jgi:hypothetical protein